MKNFKVEILGTDLILNISAKTYGDAATIGTIYTWTEDYNFGKNNIKIVVTNLANNRQKIF